MSIYLINSESYKKVKNEVNNIINNSLNVIKYDLKVNTIENVIEEANYFSLTGEEKFLVIKSDNLFKNSKSDDKDKSVDKLLKYIDNPNSMTTLIFTTYEGIDKRKKIYKKIKEIGKVIDLPTLNKKELVYECIKTLKDSGYFINYDIGNYIVDNSYVNYDIMLSEIDKIKILVPKGSVSLEMIKQVVSSSVNGSVFKYVKCLLNEDYKELNNLQKDLEVLKIDPSIVLITLYKEMQILLFLKKVQNIKEVQILFNKESWQMEDYLLLADKYSIKEIKKIIIKLADYDYKYKSGLVDKDVILDLLSVDL